MRVGIKNNETIIQAATHKINAIISTHACISLMMFAMFAMFASMIVKYIIFLFTSI